jgi:hypothetical protein
MGEGALLSKTPKVSLPKLARLIYSGFIGDRVVCNREVRKEVISIVKNFCSFLAVY